MRPDNDRVHDECDGEECAEQNGKQLKVADEGIHAARTDSIRDETHDAERGKADNPEHDLCHDDGKIMDGVLCGRTCFLQRHTGEDTPCEDADVVGVCDGVERVVDDVEDEVVNDLDDAARRSDCRIGDNQMQCRREGKGECNRDDGREEGCDDVEAHDGLQRCA